MKYLVVDPTGTVANAIVWDGVTPFDPGEGFTVIPQPEGVWIGWTRDGETWIAPLPESD